MKGFSLLPGEGIAGKVIQTGKSEIISDCQKDPRWAGKADAKTGFRTESMICVPLSLKQIVFGVIVAQCIERTHDIAECLGPVLAERLCEVSRGVEDGFGSGVIDCVEKVVERLEYVGESFGYGGGYRSVAILHIGLEGFEICVRVGKECCEAPSDTVVFLFGEVLRGIGELVFVSESRFKVRGAEVEPGQKACYEADETLTCVIACVAYGFARLCGGAYQFGGYGWYFFHV